MKEEKFCHFLWEKTQLCAYFWAESANMLYCFITRCQSFVLHAQQNNPSPCRSSTGSKQLLLASSTVRLCLHLLSYWHSMGWTRWLIGVWRQGGRRHWLNRKSLDLMTVFIFPKSNKVNVTYGSFKVQATSQDVIDSSPEEMRNLVVNP